jgi:hypothetical protein
LRTEETPGPGPAAAPAELAAAPSRSATGGSATGRWSPILAAVRRRLTAEHLVALVLGLLVLAAHDVPYLLSLSFWLDEGWVAVTTRFPLSQLPDVTNSTPIGWSALLRLVTVPGTQSSRLLPLAFAGAAVVIAYWFARQLGWPRRAAAVCAGVLAGTGALLSPAMLARDDLKQYTADACLSLLVLALTSRLERDWSRSRLAALSVACWGGMLFSDAVTFVGAAAFTALCVTAFARREWWRLAESCAVGAVTAVLMYGIYEVFDERAVTVGLIDGAHMRNYFIPLHSGLPAAFTFVISRFAGLGGAFALGPAWLAVPLVLAGIVTIFWLGRRATAVALVLLWPVVLIVNAVRRYPFLDERTNTYLIVITVVIAAIGVIGAGCWLPGAVRAATVNAGRWRPRQWMQRRWLRRSTAMTAWLAGLCVLAGVAFGWTARPYLRSENIPSQNVRGQTRYVYAHEASDDVILVDTSSSYGFAYYWPVGQPSIRPDDNVAQDYEPYFPGQPRIVVAIGGTPPNVGAAVAQAARQAQLGRCADIWFITSQESPSRLAAWTAALAQQGLSAVPVRGVAGLSLIQPDGSPCAASARGQGR